MSRHAIRGAVALAVAVGLVSSIIALTGLHQNPLASGIGSICVFILLNVAAVVWALRKTAAESTYAKQLFHGLTLGVVAGALIFVISFLLVTVAFPDYIAEAREATLDWMESSGMPADQIEKQATRMNEMTPVGQSFSGAIGTAVTSLIVAAIAGIFLRRK